MYLIPLVPFWSIVVHCRPLPLPYKEKREKKKERKQSNLGAWLPKRRSIGHKKQNEKKLSHVHRNKISSQLQSNPNFETFTRRRKWTNETPVTNTNRQLLFPESKIGRFESPLLREVKLKFLITPCSALIKPQIHFHSYTIFFPSFSLAAQWGDP